jgi:hypothetical protein
VIEYHRVLLKDIFSRIAMNRSKWSPKSSSKISFPNAEQFYLVNHSSLNTFVLFLEITNFPFIAKVSNVQQNVKSEILRNCRLQVHGLYNLPLDAAQKFERVTF